MVVLGLSDQIGFSKKQFYSFSWVGMESEYQIGDLILLNKEPHKGTTYPKELREVAEKNESVEIIKVGGQHSKTDDLYVVKVRGVPLTIYADEIAGFYSPTTLFI